MSATLLRELARDNGRCRRKTTCIGGGRDLTVVFERAGITPVARHHHSSRHDHPSVNLHQEESASDQRTRIRRRYSTPAAALIFVIVVHKRAQHADIHSISASYTVRAHCVSHTAPHCHFINRNRNAPTAGASDRTAVECHDF
jgi:hypothetical protein